MQHIQTVTLDSVEASIVFSSIPQDGTDLVALISCRSNLGASYADQLRVRFNGSTASFSNRQLQGNGSAAQSFSGSDSLIGYLPSSGFTSNTFGNATIYIPNYTSANNKSSSTDAVTENNATVSMQSIVATLRANTDAITSLDFFALEGSLVIGSSVSLYKVTAGSDGTTVVS